MKEKLYRRFRASGYSPIESARAARIYEEFTSLENEGLVRLRAEEEQESYFDVYGEPEGYTDIHGRKVSAEEERKEQERMIELYGCLWSCSEYLDENDEWQVADSCGMHTGYKDVLSPFENAYIIDQMRSAIDAAREVPATSARL